MSILGNLEPREGGEDLRKVQPQDHDQGISLGPEATKNRDEDDVVLSDIPDEPPEVGAPKRGGRAGRGGSGKSPAEPPELPPGHQPPGPRFSALWCAVLGIAFGLLGGFVYSHFTGRASVGQATQLSNLFHSVGTLEQRIEATEADLPNLALTLGRLSDRVALLDDRVDSRLLAARRLAVSEARRLKEIDQRNQAAELRLSHVERNQTEDHARLAQVNEQLEREVASLRGDLASTQVGTNQGLANLHERVSRNEDGLQNLGKQIHRGRMTFEVARNSPTELAPGISLTVLKADPRFQRIRGYVTLTAEGRTLWLENLGAHKSVDFYAQEAAHPFSLVITRVDPHAVAGYLLFPAGA